MYVHFVIDIFNYRLSIPYLKCLEPERFQIILDIGDIGSRGKTPGCIALIFRKKKR